MQHDGARFGGRRQQPPGLFGKIDQYGARLEHDKIVLEAIDDGRDPAIGIDREIFGRLLFAFAELDWLNRIREFEFFQRDRRLPAVRRRRGIQVDHTPILPGRSGVRAGSRARQPPAVMAAPTNIHDSVKRACGPA